MLRAWGKAVWEGEWGLPTDGYNVPFQGHENVLKLGCSYWSYLVIVVIYNPRNVLKCNELYTLNGLIVSQKKKTVLKNRT